MIRVPGPVRLVLALAMAGAALMTWTATPPVQAQVDPVQQGAAIFDQACSSCHGTDLKGRRGRGPTLIGVGAAAVDFYVGTGRMPLAEPGIQPRRAVPVYDTDEKDALIAYVTSRGSGGPAIPDVDPARGDVSEGRTLFTDNCSGCHQVVGQGGIAPGLIAPSLSHVTPREIGEAIRVGPYLMPRFSDVRLDERQVDSIAAYVTEVVAQPPDRGGWGIGNLGPIPEGLVAFFLAGGALVLVARLIGERAR